MAKIKKAYKTFLCKIGICSSNAPVHGMSGQLKCECCSTPMGFYSWEEGEDKATIRLVKPVRKAQ